MKNFFAKNAYVLLAALTMTACMNETDTLLNDSEGVVVFTMSTEGVNTRTSTSITDGKIVTGFVKTDEVGIFTLVDDEPLKENTKYTLSDDGWTGNKITAQDGTYSFYSYYPYKDGVKLDAAFDYEVNKAQGAVGNFNKSDLLLAKNVGLECKSTADLLVDLMYNHAFALAQVVISGSKFEVAPTSVKLTGVKTKASVTLKDGLVKTASGATGDVEMYNVVKYSEKTATYLAILPEQEIAQGAEILKLTIGDKTYSFKPSAAFTLNANKVRTIKVVMGEDEAPSFSVDLDNMVIAGWGEEEGEPIEGVLDEGEEPTKPDEPEVPIEPGQIEIPTITSTTIFTNLADGTDKTSVVASVWPDVAETGWFVKTNNGAISASATDAGVITIDAMGVTKQVASGLFYNFGKCTKTSTKYTLSCKVTPVEGTGSVYVSLLNVNAAAETNSSGVDFAFNTKGIATHANYVAAVKTTFASDAKDLSLTFDLTQGIKSAGTSSADVSSPVSYGSESYDQLVLAIIVSNGTKFEISDFTFVPAE